MTELVSGRRLAAILGVSPTAVRNAIRDGRITAQPDGRLDPDAARREWTASTDPSRSRVRTSSKVREQGAQPAKGAQPPDEPAQPSAFQLHRADKEGWTAQLRRLEYERKAGRLVDAEEVHNAVFTLARTARDRWLNWPNRVAAIMAHEIGIDPVTGKADANSVAIVLERMVREHLTEMGQETLNLRRPR